jgi:phosphoenolpyruvate-protein kinase (PTS system EI component)
MSEYNQLPSITKVRAKVRKRRKSPRERRQEPDQLGVGAMTEVPRQQVPR